MPNSKNNTLVKKNKDRKKRTLSREEIEELVKDNYKLVLNLAYKYAKKGLPIDDIIQEGSIGLIMAARRFDPNKGDFQEYAITWIKQLINRFVMKKLKLISLPYRKLEMLQKAYKELQREGKDVYNEEVFLNNLKKNIASIAEKINVDENKLRKAINGTFQVIYPYFENATEVENSNFEAVIFQDDTFNPEKAIIKEEVMEAVRKAIDKILTQKEKIVISYKYGLVNDHNGKKKYSLKDIAEILNISQESVRQIHQKALMKLRRYLEDYQSIAF